MVTMLKENFLSALQIAINARSAVEAGHGYTGDSIYVAGLKEIKKQVEAEPGPNVLLELRS